MPLKTRSALTAGLAALLLAAPAGVGMSAAQPTITAVETVMADVETVDHETGSVLLNDENGTLVTVTVPKETRGKLPRLQAGDRIALRFFQLIDAQVVPPDAPPPESTLSAAKDYVNRHPHGTMIAFRRERVRVVAVDPAAHVVTVSVRGKPPHSLVVHQRVMQEFLNTLKAGDHVDVTIMDAVTFVVTNRTVKGSASVQEQPGRY